MAKFHNVFLLLTTFCVLLAGCSAVNTANDIDTKTDSIEFTYYYHGFLIYDANTQNPVAPDETYIIDTQEEYSDFISAYELTSIYPLDTVDFEKECLIYCGLRGAQASRGWSTKIQSIHVLGEQLELVKDETVNFDTENETESVAYQIVETVCPVREVFFLKVIKENLAESLRNTYQPDFT